MKTKTDTREELRKSEMRMRSPLRAESRIWLMEKKWR